MADRSDHVRSLAGLVERATNGWPAARLAALVERPEAVAAALGSAAEAIGLGDGAPAGDGGAARRERLDIERLRERWRARAERAGALTASDFAGLLEAPPDRDGGRAD